MIFKIHISFLCQSNFQFICVCWYCLKTMPTLIFPFYFDPFLVKLFIMTVHLILVGQAAGPLVLLLWSRRGERSRVVCLWNSHTWLFHDGVETASIFVAKNEQFFIEFLFLINSDQENPCLQSVETSWTPLTHYLLLLSSYIFKDTSVKMMK